jgi:hypothetical protein
VLRVALLLLRACCLLSFCKSTKNLEMYGMALSATLLGTVGLAHAALIDIEQPERYSWAEPRTDFFNITGMERDGECFSWCWRYLVGGGWCFPFSPWPWGDGMRVVCPNEPFSYGYSCSISPNSADNCQRTNRWSKSFHHCKP